MVFEKEYSMKPLPMADLSQGPAPRAFPGAPVEVQSGPVGPEQAFVIGSVLTPAGDVSRVSSRLADTDRRGTAKARWGFGRMDYRVVPGLYALGIPDAESPVLLSANYKMSFDELRGRLSGVNAWILVLDTDGINVWCAAGKGTFSAREVARRVEESRLAEIVSHRKIIAPQLAGPGLSIRDAKRLSGFEVVFGPIRTEDIRVFLESGFRATPRMRQVTFTVAERAAVIPVELMSALKAAWIPLVFFTVVAGLFGWSSFLHAAGETLWTSFLALAFAILAGTVVVPLLLPWLPGKAFSVKGIPAGLVAAVLAIGLSGIDTAVWQGRLEAMAWILIIVTLTVYLAVNFTGCTTYTSLSGVKKEMEKSLPIILVTAAAGLILWVLARLFS